MISVDDILNAYDSSDENEAKGTAYDAVDLEAILRETDDDQEWTIDLLLDKQTSRKLNLEIEIDFSCPREPVAATDKESHQSLVDSIINDEDIYFQQSQQLLNPSDSEESKSDCISTFERAKLREQKLFQHATSPQSTTLRSKVNRATVEKYSNIATYELSSISRQLQRNASYHAHGPGIATSLLIHDIFLGIGTSKGLILLFDHRQEIRQVLGSSLPSIIRPSSAITCLDASLSGGLIVCGYESGEIALWDVGQAEILKVVSELHYTKVTKIISVSCVSEGLSSSSSTEGSDCVLTAISCDALGAVGKSSFSKRTSWTAVSYISESEHLFDRTILAAASIAALSPLGSNISGRSSFSSKYIELFGDTHIIAIDFTSDTIIAHTYPTMKVILKWNKQSITASGSTSQIISHINWTWSFICRECSTHHHHSGGSNECKGSEEYMPVLSRCYGGTVELLCIQATSSPSTGAVNRPPKEVQNPFPSFAFLQPSGLNPQPDVPSSKDLSCKVIGRAEFPGEVFSVSKWLTASQLILISQSTILVLDQQLVCLERFDLMSQHLAGPFSSICSSKFQPSTHNGQLFLCTVESIWKLFIESCFDKADGMIAMGQWLEALAFISENAKKPFSQSTLDKSSLEKYILSFVELAVNKQYYALDGGPSVSDKSSTTHRWQHFCFVAEICIEYCIGCSLQDVLYSRIFPIFKASNREAIFLQSLEAYILMGAITALPPSVVADFCEFSLRANRMASMERCIVFFQVESLDINFTTTFLYNHQMFSSFLYVYSVGSRNFVEAFQIVFYCLSPNSRSSDLDDMDVGYKLLLFVYYTFDFKLFPRGQTSDLIDVSTVLGLMSLLASTHLVPLTHLLTEDRHRSKLVDDVLYPYLTALCAVDAAGLFQVVTRGFAALQRDLFTEDQEMRRHGVLSQVAALYDNILGFAVFANERKIVDDDIVCMFYSNLELLIADFYGPLSFHFLESYIVYYAGQPLSNRTANENQLSRLLANQMSGSTQLHPDATRLHRILVSHSFFIAGLSIQTTSTLDYSAVDVFEQAMSFYISMAREEPSDLTQGTDDDVPSPSIFKYIDVQFEFIEACISHTQHYNVKAFFINEVVKSLAQLGSINLRCCSTVVHKYLSNHVSSIIEYTAVDPFIQFSLLDELIIKGGDNTISSTKSHAAQIAELFSMEDLLTYFSLLCHCQPMRVLPFLKQFENYYPVDNYLMASRQKGLSEAVSFLMEKSGEVLEALHVLLRDLSQQLKTARRDIDLQLRTELSAQSVLLKEKSTPRSLLSISLILTKQGIARSELIMRLPSYKEVQTLISCIVELCSRHGEAMHSSMWLTAFDHLLLERREYIYIVA